MHRTVDTLLAYVPELAHMYCAYGGFTLVDRLAPGSNLRGQQFVVS